MAKNLFFNRAKNAKPRALLLFGGILCSVVALGITLAVRHSAPLQTQETMSAKPPQITAIPGNVTSEKYKSLQEEDNKRRADKAKKTGDSAIATIIGDQGDGSIKNQTLGIEDQFGKCPSCACNNDKDPLSVALSCPMDADAAIHAALQNKRAALQLLNDCPTLAQAFAEKNPILFKQLLLENPDLAKRIEPFNPELIKQLILSDPIFARQLALSNPTFLKAVMSEDPKFSEAFSEKNPDLFNKLLLDDPSFAKKLLLSDSGFAKRLALSHPALLKKLLTEDPIFAKQLLLSNPDLAKQVALSDPAFLKTLLSENPDFAKAFAEKNPEIFKKMLLSDPAFAKKIATSNALLLKQLLHADPEFAKALALSSPEAIQTAMNAVDPIAVVGNQDRERVLSADERRRQEQATRLQAAQQAQLNEQQQKQLALLVANMEGQSKNILKNLEQVNPQQFVQGNESTNKDKNQAAASDNKSSETKAGSNANQKVLIKAGTILYASLDTAVNSDEPGPVMGTIVQGDYKGAKIVGALQSAQSTDNRPEKIILSFTTLSPLDAPASLSISAVAVDPDSARTALASDVDHHYLLRYGTLLASSFATGYAKVISSQGSSTISNTTTGVTQTNTPPLNGKQQIYAALGQVGQNMGTATSSYFNTPNTITVDQGTGFGLLILKDVSDTNA